MWINKCNYAESLYSCIFMAKVEPDIIGKAQQCYVPSHTPEEVAQELRLQLWRKIDKWDCRKSGFRTWANKVIDNKIKDLQRQTFRKNRDVLNDSKTTFTIFLEK